jgi:Cu/Ag efflux protein CusF
MKPLNIFALGVLAVLSQPLLAQQSSETEGSSAKTPTGATAMKTMKATATVVGIDPATRMVTLKRSNGQVVNVTASEEVRNFDQIKVGDMVTAEYTQALSVDLKKGGSGIRESVDRESAARASEGAKPGGAVGREITILANVVSVNKKDQTVRLQGPHGNMVDVKVQDPEDLNNVKKGDQVQAVYTEALAVAVQPAPSTSGK